MKKLSKLRKFSIALTSGLAAGIAGIGITVPLIQNQSTTLVTDSEKSSGDFSGYENFTKTDSSIQSENLSFTPANSSSSTFSMSRNASVTDENKGTQMLWTQSGEQKEFKVSTVFKNNRKFMPMLAYDTDDVANFSQTRIWIDLVLDDFPGWERTSVKNTFSQNGSYVHKYTATDTLKKAYPNLQKTEITKLVICLSDLVYKVKDTTNYKEVVQKLIDEVNPDYLDLQYVNDSNIQYLPELNNSNLRKLSISGGFTSLSSLKISDKVQEIEVKGSLTSIDPLIFPKDAAFITESGSAIFTEINLSAHKNLTTEELQKAVDIVYKDRINERAFQGDFAGGYIYSWNLRNTGISSFNSVTIPELNDGTDRFYIAYVAVETENNNGTVEEVISEGTQPSNDSQIKEWFDWNPQGWEKVSDIIVTAKDSAKLDFNKTVKEIMGFLQKYPNVVKIDVSSLKFTDDKKTLSDLETQLKNEIKGKYFEDSPLNKIEFVINEKV
ncbi:MAG: IgG-blocking protein M [Malacoplasma sp.]|nr:IgG-blocking protein M [Malacoplasma sp.]MDE5774936.1 IgG-blocking protein M [Malacoplasma sp.]MDE7100084.1 IgG-blocking protein M [Malacoplasma sp.]